MVSFLYLMNVGAFVIVVKLLVMKSSKLSKFFPPAFAILAVIIFILFSKGAQNFSNLTHKNLSIGDSIINVAIADTPQTRERGLSGTKSLKAGQGMLFVFEKPDYQAFWMKDMNYPLDFVWIGPDYTVKDVTENVLPESYPKAYSPKEPVTMVLEISAGEIEKKNIKIGDEVLLSE